MTKYTITSLILVGTNIFVWRVPPPNLPPPSCFHCQNIPLSNNFHHNIFGYQIIQPMWIWTLSWFHWVWAESSDCYYDRLWCAPFILLLLAIERFEPWCDCPKTDCNERLLTGSLLCFRLFLCLHQEYEPGNCGIGR